ncbi:MAG: UDP binding domain-containing protein, partial [Acetivibrio ethanolgignens]
SPAIRVIEVLKREGAEVEYYDPWVTEYKEHGQVVTGLKEISPEIVKSYDLVMVTTAHTNVDYQMVSDNAVVVFDTKNVMKQIENRDNIEVL